MSVNVVERKVDKKRRVTLPQNMEVKEGSRVIMMASKDAAVVAADSAFAEKLSEALREAEREKKYEAIDEWARLIEEAGLSGLRAKDIDRLVGQGVSDEVIGSGKKKNRG